MDAMSTSHNAPPAMDNACNDFFQKPARPLPSFQSIAIHLGDRLVVRKQLTKMAKPKISLKIGNAGSFSTNSPIVATPLVTPGGNRIKLSIGANKANIPNDSAPVKPFPKAKVGRPPKVPAKSKTNNKNGKRIREDEIGDVGGSMRLGLTGPDIPAKKIKFSLSATTPVATTPKTPFIKAKFRGKPPKRPLGEGYDSEASDREDDPTIEEEWILRMIPGPDCDYLREMIQERKIGIPKSQGGADVHFKFFQAEGRRAAITIRGQPYAATMVDLPCIIEGMKSWDKKGWYKSADICQMLLVFAKIPHDTEAEKIELPKVVDPNTFQYPHGLTAPMHYARKRRFRPRIDRRAVEEVENEVERLLAADASEDVHETRYELTDLVSERGVSYGDEMEDDEDAYGEDDAEGEEDDTNGYFPDQSLVVKEEEEQEIDLEAMLGDMEDEGPDVMENELSQAVLETSTIAEADTPQQTQPYSGDESIEDDDDRDQDEESDSEDELDEEERERNAEREAARQDIADMDAEIEKSKAQMAATTNAIIISRCRDKIAKIQAEREIKLAALGDVDED